MDLEKIKEVLDLLHPYMRWLMLIAYGGMFLYINRMFVKDPVLRKWVLSSFEEQNGRASGKAITSFVFSKLIAFSTMVAIVYAPNHLLPEYFLISLLTFVASLYGIKMASKYFNGSTTDTTTTDTTTTDNNTKEVIVSEHKNDVPLTDDEKKKKEEAEKKINNPDDVG